MIRGSNPGHPARLTSCYQVLQDAAKCYVVMLYCSDCNGYKAFATSYNTKQQLVQKYKRQKLLWARSALPKYNPRVLISFFSRNGELQRGLFSRYGGFNQERYNKRKSRSDNIKRRMHQLVCSIWANKLTINILSFHYFLQPSILVKYNFAKIVYFQQALYTPFRILSVKRQVRRSYGSC